MRIRFEFIIVLIAVISLSFYMFGPISDDGVGAASRISPLQKSRVSASSRYAVPPLAVSANKTNTTSPKIYIPSTTLCGDVNGDGRVATVDSMILSQVQAGLSILNPSNAACADLNDDRRIDRLDSYSVAQIALGVRSGIANCNLRCLHPDTSIGGGLYGTGPEYAIFISATGRFGPSAPTSLNIVAENICTQNLSMGSRINPPINFEFTIPTAQLYSGASLTIQTWAPQTSRKRVVRCSNATSRTAKWYSRDPGMLYNKDTSNDVFFI